MQTLFAIGQLLQITNQESIMNHYSFASASATLHTGYVPIVSAFFVTHKNGKCVGRSIIGVAAVAPKS